MQEGLSLSTVQTGDLAAGNMIGYLFMAVLGGVLASRVGARWAIAGSLFLVAAAMALTGASRSFASALVGRELTGLGAGGRTFLSWVFSSRGS